MTARWRDNMISLGVRRTRSALYYFETTLIQECFRTWNRTHCFVFKSHFCLLRCSPHCHVLCALCYFIVVGKFSHRVALFSVSDSSSLILIIRLFSKCKNDRPKTNGIFLVNNFMLRFRLKLSLLKFVFCYVTFDVRLLNKERSSLFNLRFFVFSFFVFIRIWV